MNKELAGASFLLQQINPRPMLSGLKSFAERCFYSGRTEHSKKTRIFDL